MFIVATLDEVLDFLWTVLGWIVTGVQLAVPRVRTMAGPVVRRYFRALGALWGAMIALSGLVTLIGVLIGSRPVIATGGLIAMLGSLLGLLAAAPLGVLIDMALGLRWVGAAGARYVRFGTWVLMVEGIVAMTLTIVPFRDNPGMLPIVLLGAAVLGTASVLWGTSGMFGKKLVVFAASILVVAGVFSCFMPETASRFNDRTSRLDRQIGNAIAQGGGYRSAFSVAEGRPLPCSPEDAWDEASLPQDGEATLLVSCSGKEWSARVNNPHAKDPKAENNRLSQYRFQAKPENGTLDVRIFFGDGEEPLVMQGVNPNTRKFLDRDYCLRRGWVTGYSFRLASGSGPVKVKLLL